MKLVVSSSRTKRTEGSILFNTVVFSGVLGIASLSLVQLSNQRVRAAYNRLDYNQAYYQAENALNWAIQRTADVGAGSEAGQFAMSNDEIGLSYLDGNVDEALKNIWVTVTTDPSGTADHYQITASAKVGDKVRTLQSTVHKNPSSQVFDYEYFLNNWGWWWGSAITGGGDNRSNWDFDLKYSPNVNGSILANGIIASGGSRVDPFAPSVPVAGMAGADPVAYLHDGTARLHMPNLQDFTYYSGLATASGSTLSIGTTVVVNGVHNNATEPGLFLEGTASNPVTINGPVVVPGDVVIKGPISGIGTLYVGGNLYIAGDVTYANGPDFSTPPETMTPTSRDYWVSTAKSSNKDLFAFAVREAIFAGQVNSSDWRNRCYHPSGYGLKNVGAEANLGADGISGTPDDGVNYLDTNDDGYPDSAWYDADNDGVVDNNYNYSTDIQMTTTRADKIHMYPTSGGAPANFNSHSSSYFNRLDGIYYCNHAMAMRSTKAHFKLNGAVIARDEALVVSTSINMKYDSRIHSRYSTDPNLLIDLKLPVAKKVKIKSMAELAPIAGFYAP